MARQTGDQHWTRRRKAAGLPAGNLNGRKVEGALAPIWKVTRFCCTSGQCVDCHRRAKGWKISMTERRHRITHADKMTKPHAEFMARNWRDYDAKVEAM